MATVSPHARPFVRHGLSRQQRLGRGPQASLLSALGLVFLVHGAFLLHPLGIDEAGFALVGQGLLQSGKHAHGLYGNLWVDRSPMLVALYGFAQVTAGAIGIRLIGLVAALVLVVMTNAATRRLGFTRAAPAATLVAAILASAPCLAANLAYPELVGAALVASCVALVAPSVRGDRVGATAWLSAGILAGAAVLAKQSFIDGAVAGGALALLVPARGSRERIRRAGTFVAGVSVVFAAVVAWAVFAGPGIGSVAYAMFGFRIDAARALANASVPMSNRFRMLGDGLVAMGAPVLLPLALGGLLRARRELGSAPTLAIAGWLGAGIVGVLAGGYYWPHYLIQLIPVVSVLAGIGVSSLRRRPVAIGATALFLATIVATTAWAGGSSHHAGPSHTLGVAHYLQGKRRPHDTLFVLYSRANLVYYSGMQPAFPYQWSSMYRAKPGVEAQLEQLLRSDHPPTWIVEWQKTDSFGLDRDGDIAALLATRYREAAEVCGHPVLLLRGDPRAARIGVDVPTTCVADR